MHQCIRTKFPEWIKMHQTHARHVNRVIFSKRILDGSAVFGVYTLCCCCRLIVRLQGMLGWGWVPRSEFFKGTEHKKFLYDAKKFRVLQISAESSH